MDIWLRGLHTLAEYAGLAVLTIAALYGLGCVAAVIWAVASCARESWIESRRVVRRRRQERETRIRVIATSTPRVTPIRGGGPHHAA